MKGLILKELYLVKSFMKQCVLIMLLMAAFSVMMHNISFIATYIIILSSSMVMSTASMDEAVSFNKLAVTMPIDSGKLVKSKYAILFISFIGGGALICLLSVLINVLPMGTKDLFSTDGMIVILAFFIAADAIAMPVMFKVGAIKARYTYIFVMLVAGAVILVAFKFAQMSGISLDEMLEGMEGTLNLSAAGVSAVIVIISYFISVKIVQKKEW